MYPEALVGQQKPVVREARPVQPEVHSVTDDAPFMTLLPDSPGEVSENGVPDAESVVTPVETVIIKSVLRRSGRDVRHPTNYGQ